ncbi:MAG TPA: PadR family transcriptional regulator [Candidatus Limnocylindrales bacterium]|nr:PadR family transcriptional regulator [Candidatus Limnocylindrales bacterium]
MVASSTARGQLTELRRGVLEHCVLAILREGESYAFEIVRVLSQAGELLTSEGTIYPLLARLRRDGLVTTSWRDSESGPPRRYYRLTDDGRTSLTAFGAEWARFRDAVDAILAEGPSDRPRPWARQGARPA